MDDAEYELVMPFVAVHSGGGPYDDESYVAGFEMGRLDATLAGLGDTDVIVHSGNREQADLVAMRHGYLAAFEETGDPDWLRLTVHRHF